MKDKTQPQRSNELKQRDYALRKYEKQKKRKKEKRKKKKSYRRKKKREPMRQKTSQ